MTSAAIDTGKMLYPNVIFDLDGTLIDSSDSIVASFRTVFSEFGLRPVKPFTSDLFGPPLMEMLQLLTGTQDEAVLRPLEKAFKAHYDSKGYKDTRVYHGIDKLLLGLKHSGIKMHIATNKRINPTKKILNLLEWNNFFEGIYALDSFSPPAKSKAELLEKIIVKHKFKHNKIVYIGDRKEDKFSSESHGIPFIRANWGYDPVSVPDHKVATSPASLQIMLA